MNFQHFPARSFIGLAADFSYSEARPTESSSVPVETQVLRSGDVLLFGGASRMLYHGVTNVCSAHTFPADLQMRKGRLNLTFRKI